MMAESTGALVGAIFNASSTLSWARQGYGRRMVFLFERGILVLETDLRGRPQGGKEWFLQHGELDFTTIPEHVNELVALDPRNVLISINEIASARITSQHFKLNPVRVLVLDVTLRDGHEYSLLWAPQRTYHRIQPDGSLPQPAEPYEAAVADLRRIIGSRLMETPQALG